MATENEPLRSIGNESNTIQEIEPGSNPNLSDATAAATEYTENDQRTTVESKNDLPPYSNDLATNDGSLIETMDTAFHGKPGVAEGENPSGSDRADYYEKAPDGRSDANEEVSS